ncbi:MAG: hypothetical protein FJ291_17500 [Planctomycetes bacterium]|nr:hypothetical protein [Planctomycetota bacterium]
METLTLPNIAGRDDMVRILDGYSADRAEELRERKLRRELVKSHLIELLNGHRQCRDEELRQILARRGMALTQKEEGLFLVRDTENTEIGFLERLTTRILALYSTLKSDILVHWVNRTIRNSPELDHVWLSGQTFGVLWRLMVRLSDRHRFTRLVFTHERLYDIDTPGDDSEDAVDEETDVLNERRREIREQRETRLGVVDRVGIIDEKLTGLQGLYPPFHAISQLRFPSPVGRGGHDFYDNGRVTNRSESFRDHRSHLLFVVRIYQQLLESTEQRAWYSVTEDVGSPGQFHRIVGAPVSIRFQGDGLSKEVFDRWVDSTFSPAGNRFRLWGNPIRLGPTKVHVYGVDRHLWQPMFLEATAKGCTAIVPKETCGNTVHRLVTNIQRYLDPGCAVHIGETPYEEVIQGSAKGIPYDVQT